MICCPVCGSHRIVTVDDECATGYCHDCKTFFDPVIAKKWRKKEYDFATSIYQD